MSGDQNTVWLVEQGEYEQAYIAAAFTDEKLADEYAADKGGSVQAIDLFDRAVQQITSHVRIAEVYPDKTVKRHTHTEKWDEPGPPALDNHMDPWDGHTQTHCGFHIYVSGADRQLVEEEFERQIAATLERCTGTCPGCGRTERFLTDWMNPPTQTIPVRLIGGERDGEIEPTEFPESINDPSDLHTPINGLLYWSASLPDGPVVNSYYGPIQREGDEWVRRCRGAEESPIQQT